MSNWHFRSAPSPMSAFAGISLTLVAPVASVVHRHYYETAVLNHQHYYQWPIHNRLSYEQINHQRSFIRIDLCEVQCIFQALFFIFHFKISFHFILLVNKSLVNLLFSIIFYIENIQSFGIRFFCCLITARYRFAPGPKVNVQQFIFLTSSFYTEYLF